MVVYRGRILRKVWDVYQVHISILAIQHHVARVEIPVCQPEAVQMFDRNDQLTNSGQLRGFLEFCIGPSSSLDYIRYQIHAARPRCEPVFTNTREISRVYCRDLVQAF